LAVARYSAFHLSRGERDRAVEITERLSLFMLLTGLFLSIANYYSAPYVANVFLGRASLTPYLQLASVFVIAQIASVASGSVFVGWSLASESGSISQATLR